MTVCAIHQPNFFPWLGYFDKIKKADVFIFLDEVAYPKSGSGSGSWCNRVKMLSGGTPDWFGIPIQRASGEQLIKDVLFSNKTHALKKLKKSLEHNYKKYQHFDAAMAWLEPLLFNSEMNLASYNMHVIKTMAEKLGLTTRFVKQSELTHHKHSTALLVELVEQVGADAYLCGQGSTGYQEDVLFEQAGIELIYQHDEPMQFTWVHQTKIEDRSLSMIHHAIRSYELLEV
jgi:hypothetical protein